MLKIIFTFAGLSGLIGVALGAFGAHGLRGSVEPRMLEVWQTGVSYQLIHSLVLLVCCILMHQWGKLTALTVASGFFMAGILLFSGSLYLLVLTSQKWLGPITPLGGVCFLAGWLALIWSAWQAEI